MKTLNSSVTAQFGSAQDEPMLSRLLGLLPTETLSGYENPELVDVIFRKTVAYRPTGKWSETARTVLDFGGGCGLHYKEAGLNAKWAVVETPTMVSRAKELETDELKFFTSIRDAASWLGHTDLMHSNGALQYTSEPEAVLRDLVALQATVLLWKRTALATEREAELQASRLADNGPGRITAANKIVSYPTIRMAERDFLAAHSGYRLQDRTGFDFRFVRERG